MTLFDFLAVGLIAMCIIASMIRGVVTEVASLFTWVIAFFAAKFLAVPFANIALQSVEPRALAVAGAFMMVFVSAWLGQRFLRTILTSLISAIGLGGINRMLGGVFGAVKGLVLVTLAVLVCAFTDLPRTAEWRQATTAPFFETLASFAVPYLPEYLADKIQYPTA